jgi:hypothetical protein
MTEPELPGQEPLFPWDEYEDDEWEDTDDPLMCLADPRDCPLGPEPHQWVPSGPWPESACCCRQPWEDDPPRHVDDLPPL